MTEKALKRDPKTGRFLNANRGGGRPKGARNKLSEGFLLALHEDFEAFGVEAIKALRQERPCDYLKVIASLLPKNLEVAQEDFSNFSKAELRERARSVAREIVLELCIADIPV